MTDKATPASQAADNQDLDGIMAASMETFSGDSDAPFEPPAPPETQDEDAVARDTDDTDDAEAAAAAADAEPQPEDLPPEATVDIAEPEAAANEEEDVDAAAAAAEADDDDPPATRFKTHEEAEKGYKDLQSKTTKVEQENTELKQRLEEKEKAEAEQAAAEQRTKTITEYTKNLRAFSKEQQEKVIAETDKLDPDSMSAEEYNLAVAELMADKDAVIEAWKLENRPSLDTPPAAAAEEPAGSDADADALEAAEAERAVVAEKVAAVELASGEALTIEDPVFVHFAVLAPSVDDAGEEISFDDQIQWAIDRTTEHYGKIEKGIRKKTATAAQAVTDKHQRANQPMARGGTAPAPKAKNTEPVSLDSALSTVASERTYDGRGSR